MKIYILSERHDNGETYEYKNIGLYADKGKAEAERSRLEAESKKIKEFRADYFDKITPYSEAIRVSNNAWLERKITKEERNKINDEAHNEIEKIQDNFKKESGIDILSVIFCTDDTWCVDEYDVIE